MPEMMYTRREVNLIIRIAYATGARDVLVELADGKLLSEDDATKLARLVTDPSMLKPTVTGVYDAAALAFSQGVKSSDE